MIRKLYIGDPKAYEEKTKFHTELGSIEPFLESCPSIFIMTLIWAHAMDASLFSDSLDCNKVDSSACAVFGGSYDSFSFAWFWITYAISVLAGSLGITKLLMNGPCPVLTEDGRLGGILTYPFFTHFMAVAFCMGSKGAFVGLCIGFVSPQVINREEYEKMANNDNVVLMSMTCLVLTLVPNIIFSFISIAVATGCNQKFFRIILDYPAIWLLPAVTFFVVGPENRTLRENLSCNKSGKRSLLGVSSKLTFLNIILTLVMYMIIAPIVCSYLEFSGGFFLILVSIIPAPLFILAIIFTFFCFRCCHCKCCYCLSCFQVNKRYIMISKDTDEVLIRHQPDHS